MQVIPETAKTHSSPISQISYASSSTAVLAINWERLKECAVASFVRDALSVIGQPPI